MGQMMSKSPNNIDQFSLIIKIKKKKKYQKKDLISCFIITHKRFVIEMRTSLIHNENNFCIHVFSNSQGYMHDFLIINR